MLCVLILYISGGTYSLKSTPNDRFLEKLFMAILFTLRVLARNLLRRNRRRKYAFRISFCCLACYSNPGFSSNKLTHFLRRLLDWPYDAKTKYPLQGKLYTGRQKGEEREMNQVENVLIQLTKPYSNSGRTIVAGNFFYYFRRSKASGRNYSGICWFHSLQ